jgi:hypothetical protein
MGGEHVAGEMLTNTVKKLKEKDYLGNLVVDGILK